GSISLRKDATRRRSAFQWHGSVTTTVTVRRRAGRGRKLPKRPSAAARSKGGPARTLARRDIRASAQAEHQGERTGRLITAISVSSLKAFGAGAHNGWRRTELSLRFHIGSLRLLHIHRKLECAEAAVDQIP